jgi:hypothetical protein
MPRERDVARRAEEEQRQRELGRDTVQAQKLVAIWNSRAKRGARPSFYPTMETAIARGHAVLSYICPSCQLVGEVDLRKPDRHPAMPISGPDPLAVVPAVLSESTVRETAGSWGRKGAYAGLRRRKR